MINSESDAELSALPMNQSRNNGARIRMAPRSAT